VVHRRLGVGWRSFGYGALILFVCQLITRIPAVQVIQMALATRQIRAVIDQPVWVPLLAAWERLCTLPVQVALSVMVLQVFRRGRLAWL
jgi:uncharacterized membrane protein YhfC